MKTRKYLFRGFNPCDNGTRTITLDGKKIKGEWVYGDLIHSWAGKNTKLTIRIYNNIRKFKVLPETVCEYTGRTDKNGIKIFEGGGIVIPLYYNKEHYFKVVFSSKVDVGMAYMLMDSVENILWIDDWDDCEVICNIFENPELLGDNSNDD